MRCFVLFALLLLLGLALAALCAGAGLVCARQAALGVAFGGARARGMKPAGRVRPDPAGSPHIVVDTLNLAHWRSGAGQLTPELIVETIGATAPALRARHPGRVMYVLKDRESRFNDDASRSALLQAAARTGAYIAVAERYADPPRGVPPSAEHSALGRDDFLLAVLAQRWHCAVLTEDRFRDFGRLRATVQPFHVYEFAPWSDLPSREYIRPESAAYTRLRRPRALRFADYFGEGAGAAAPAAKTMAPEVDAAIAAARAAALR